MRLVHFRIRCRAFFSAFVLILLAPPIAYAEKPVTLSVVGFVSRGDEVSPRVYIGAHFSIAPGWHLYWQNPGDTGLPTTVSVSLPPGFSQGPLRWPLPLLFNKTGQPLAVGYEGEVVVISEVAPPADYQWRSGISVTVRGSWLGCSARSCFRDSSEVSADITGAAAKPRSFFEEWLSRVPSDARSHSAVKAFRKPDAETAALVWREKVTEVVVIPHRPAFSGGEKLSISTNEGEAGELVTSISIPNSLTTGDDAEKGLVLFRRSAGPMEGINVPLKPSAEELF